MILSDEQASTAIDLSRWHAGDAQHCVLSGPAGTGKSVLVLTWLQGILELAPRLRVAIVAPTNRAVRRMRRATEVSLPKSVQYMTIHSLLGCREVVTPEGLLVFRPQFNDYPKTDDVDLIVIDEASMVGQELYQMLTSHIQTRHKVLWMGDLRQLKPVRDDWAPVFADDFKAVRLRLTQIQRQAEGSPILAAADAVTSAHTLRSVSTSKGTLTIERSRTIFTDLSKSLVSTELSAFRLLAWTNVQVDLYNAALRESLFGQELPYVVEGDCLAARAPCMDDQTIVLLNSDEVTVTRVVLKKDKLLEDLSLDVFDVEALTEDNLKVRLRVLDPGSKPLFNQLLGALKDEARAAQMKGVSPKTAWSNYFALKERYHDLAHAWAMTIHRSQGGTFNQVALLGSDVLRARDADERARLWYTGATRASEHLIIHI